VYWGGGSKDKKKGPAAAEPNFSFLPAL